jgi:2'-hydroxyisoflavone reductase
MSAPSLLLIGGTRFVGRALLEEALALGWNVTAFHRGQTGGGLFEGDPRVTHILGDRDTDLSPLAEGRWDAVVDCIGYFPEPTTNTAEFLKGRVSSYAFISTISVYQESDGPFDEATSALMTLPEGIDATKLTGETYGGLKVLCEEGLDRVTEGKCLHIRAGLQIGPHDPTNRFSEWVERIGRRPSVVVPGDPATDWQFIDARDTARFTLKAISQGLTGSYNVTGEVIPMMDVLSSIRTQLNPGCEFIAFSDKDLAEKGVAPWSDLSLWVPKAGS